jgi:hypothetical protein
MIYYFCFYLTIKIIVIFLPTRIRFVGFVILSNRFLTNRKLYIMSYINQNESKLQKIQYVTTFVSEKAKNSNTKFYGVPY